MLLSAELNDSLSVKIVCANVNYNCSREKTTRERRAASLCRVVYSEGVSHRYRYIYIYMRRGAAMLYAALVLLSTAILIIINEPRGKTQLSVCLRTRTHRHQRRLRRTMPQSRHEVGSQFDYRCSEFNVKTEKAWLSHAGTFIIG